MIRAIVTDIEGTTSDIQFVHQILFPYARQHLPQFIHEFHQQPAVQRALETLRNESQQANATVEQLIELVIQYIDQDRKSPGLKTLQGMVWRNGYETHQFIGDIYADVVPALQKWRDQGIDLYVYSSGSVAAQKLLFGYSIAGDITPLFTGYFDTQVGAKRSITSYQNIAAQLQLPSDSILFLSDIAQELDAATAAGWQGLQLIRGAADPASSHPQVSDFSQIQLEDFA